MDEILALIEEKKKIFANSPLFDFMQDQRIETSQRLVFAPCMSHFVMSFSDLNKYLLREEKTSNFIQQIVNQYTFEDDNHWPWFLADINQLQLNPTSSFTETLSFIWSEDTKITRHISYIVVGYAFKADPEIKLVIIQVLEAAADIFFSISRKIVLELSNKTNQEYLYFGDMHLEQEIEHTMSSEESQEFISDIELTLSQKEYAIEIVENLFNLFGEWTNELLDYALTRNIQPVTYDDLSEMKMLA